MYLFLFIYIITATLLMKFSSRGAYFKFANRKVHLRMNAIYSFLLIIPFVVAYVARSFDVGTDTKGIYYGIYYTGYAVHGWKATMYERLFIELFRLCERIFHSFQATEAIICILICLPFIYYFVINRRKYDLTITMLGLLVWIFAPSLNVMRQILAVSICFIALQFLQKKKVIGFIAFTLIAMFIQITAVSNFVLLLPYFFGNRKKYRRTIPYLFALVPIVIIIFANVLIRIPIFSKFAPSVTGFTLSSINTKFFIFPLLTFPILFTCRKELIEDDEFNYIYLCAAIFSASSVLFSGLIWYGFRIMYYFLPSTILMLSRTPQLIKRKKNKFLIRLYMFAVYIITFILIYYYWKTDHIVPYIFR